MNKITDIVFEQIKDNYYWGKYGEFKVIIDINTGYINVTHLCGLVVSGGGVKKEFSEWKLLADSNELMNELIDILGIPRVSLINIITISDPEFGEICGTYCHPDLIPHIASWANPKFAVKVSKIVNEYLIHEYKESIKVKDQTINQLKTTITEIKMQNIKQSQQITGLLAESRAVREENNITLQQLDIITSELENISATVFISPSKRKRTYY